MSRKMNRWVLFMIALVSFLSLVNPSTAFAAEDELLQAPNPSNTLEDIFDDFVSYLWQFLSPSLSAPPAAVSIWNH